MPHRVDRSRDHDAFAGLVAETHADIWRLCAYLVDRDSADDLSQDTYLRAHRAYSGFRGDAPARQWLLTIARRVCAAEIDRRVRRRELSLTVAPLIPSASPAPDVVELEALIASLDRDRRTAFVLTQVIGCDYAEAAAICEVPVGTIRSRVARARADLIAELENASVALHN